MLIANDDETQNYPMEMFAVTSENKDSYFGKYIRTAPLRRLVRLFSRIIKIKAWDYFDIITDFGKNKRYFMPLMYCMYVGYSRSGNPDEMTAYYRRCSVSSNVPDGSFANGVSLCAINGPIPIICGCNSFIKRRSSTKYSGICPGDPTIIPHPT